LSPALAELVQPGFIEIGAADAQLLGVAEGDGLIVTTAATAAVDNTLATLEARINGTMAAGCAGYSVGLAGVQNLSPLEAVYLGRAEGWQRRSPELIGSDRDAGTGGTHV